MWRLLNYITHKFVNLFDFKIFWNGKLKNEFCYKFVFVDKHLEFGKYFFQHNNLGRFTPSITSYILGLLSGYLCSSWFRWCSVVSDLFKQLQISESVLKIMPFL